MKDWYLRQNPRDRLIVLFVAALTVIGLLYAFVWFPLVNGLDNNRTLINTKRETLQKVQGLSSQIQSMGNSGVQLKNDNGKPPYALIDELIRAGQIGRPDRVEPRGANGARVQFSEVEFDKLVLVLAELELYGLSVETMTISRSAKNTGMVSARFNMEKN